MRPSLVLAFDTATPVATTALVGGTGLLGERRSRASTVLVDADALMRAAGVSTGDLEGVVVGTGPGSFTGLRIGLASALGLAIAGDLPAAGVSTLDALAAAAPDVLPVIDARRHEVFSLVDGEARALSPEELEIEPGTVCVGDGAVRYRSVLEAAGATIPPDDSELHLPRARYHVQLAHDFGPAELVRPTYVREPDAVRRTG